MRILIAPDKFKHSLEASDVADRLAAGIAAVLPGAEVDTAPVADGGEGTVDAALGSGFHPVRVPVSGPLGNPLEATFAVRGTTAVIEMAAASGLAVLPAGADGRSRRDALRASSTGTGQLIKAALDVGCTEIVLGVGGSAGTDGGAGLLQALGVRLLTADGTEVDPGGGALVAVQRIDLAGLDPRVTTTSFVLAADVTNPLLGPDGAAAVFGPQKGASPGDVATLELALTRYATVVAAGLQVPVEHWVVAPGAGAAGGVGFAALAVLGARQQSGIDVVLDLIDLDERMAGVDAVITGEGSLDRQSLGGKTPLGVLQRARRHHVPTVIAVCGRSLLTPAEVRAAGFDHLFALTDREPDPRRSMQQAGPLLVDVGREIAALLRGVAA